MSSCGVWSDWKRVHDREWLRKLHPHLMTSNEETENIGSSTRPVPSISTLFFVQECMVYGVVGEGVEWLEKGVWMIENSFVDDRNSCEVATHDVINKLTAVHVYNPKFLL